MKTPTPNLPIIRSMKEEVEFLTNRVMSIPNSITEQWIRQWNEDREKIVRLKAKITNLRQGKPELGYGDKMPTYNLQLR